MWKNKNKIIIEDNKDNIIFNSDFDSGSLLRVSFDKNFSLFIIQVAYDTDYKNNDSNISSWFYFKIKNLRKNHLYKFQIKNIGILRQIVI